MMDTNKNKTYCIFNKKKENVNEIMKKVFIEYLKDKINKKNVE